MSLEEFCNTNLAYLLEMKGVLFRINHNWQTRLQSDYYYSNELSSYNIPDDGGVEYEEDNQCSVIGIAFNYKESNWNIINVELIPFLIILSDNYTVFNYQITFFNTDKRQSIQLTTIEELDSLESNGDFLAGGSRIQYISINVKNETN